MRSKLAILLGFSCYGLTFSQLCYASESENCLSFLPGRLNQNLMIAQKVAEKHQATTYLLPATPATTQWGIFDKDQPPVLRIKSGDSVVIETDAASDNQVVPGVSINQVAKMNNAVPGRGPHTITGPIYVEGAEPGDVIRIHFNKIMPRPYASNNSLPGKGLLPEKFPDGQIRYFYLDTDKMQMQFAPGIVVPLHPFPGTIGVARAESGQFDTVPPGKFGGNMDLPPITQGTNLYLPVFVSGALLGTGDSHAGQGNGEVNLTAIETAFSELNITIDVIKNKNLEWPLAETSTDWVTVGYDQDFNKAIAILESQTTNFIMQNRKVSYSQAQQLMYHNWNCPVAEVVDEVNGAYCLIPKDPNAAKPAPLQTKDNDKEYVTYAKNPQAMQAIKDATWEMITKISKLKAMQQIDVYSLLSLTMDCRIAPHYQGSDYEIHCMLPKNLWVNQK